MKKILQLGLASTLTLAAITTHASHYQLHINNKTSRQLQGGMSLLSGVMPKTPEIVTLKPHDTLNFEVTIHDDKPFFGYLQLVDANPAYPANVHFTFEPKANDLAQLKLSAPYQYGIKARISAIEGNVITIDLA